MTTIWRRLLVFSGIAMAAIVSAGDAPALSSTAFLAQVRNPPAQPAWAILTGEVRHKKGDDFSVFPIELRAQFGGGGVKAQVLFNKGERFMVSQDYRAGLAGSQVVCQQEPAAGAVRLKELGVQPADLTLGFLYWDFVEEMPAERIKLQRCRVFRLRQPDTGEIALARIVEKFLFPIQVEWFKPEATTAHRSLEFKGFEEMNGFWLVKEMDIRDAAWKTRVIFADNDIHAIRPDSPVPDDLFIP